MKTSIIITSYNYGPYIERCLRSCMNQKMVDGTNEIIIVDDCSSDNTLAIIEKFARFPNVHVIANKTNVGVAEAANIGIRASVGQYVVRVDADDYISEWFIFFLRSYLEANHDAFGVACDYQLVDDHENFIERGSAADQPVSCGIMYRRDLLAAQGLYNSDYRHCEEEELRRRVGDDYKIYHLQMPLYRYRKHGSNKTTSVEYESVRQEFVAK
ncbi:MAG: glycosyltransferase family A protein [Myxococcota bacterium]